MIKLGIQPTAVIAFLKRQNAAVLQLPERIEFVENMPFTKAEKLDKQALRKDIEEKLMEETPQKQPK